MLLIYLIFTLLTAALFLMGGLNFFNINDKKKKEILFQRLSREGTANGLIFCSQEVLQNKVIGIDGIHRKIMVLEKMKNKFNCSIISLDGVQNCELITKSGTLFPENVVYNETEKSLRAIALHFEFKDQAQPASIIFYDSAINSKRELVILKAKAEYWRVMLSKMLTRKVPAPAF